MPTIERSETRTGTSPWRNWKYISIGLIAFVAAIVIGLAAFPWGALGGTIQKRLSQSLGREVTIGSVERVDHFSLHPVIELRNVTIPQPEWVKNTAPMLHVGRIRIGFAALPVLLGRQRLERIEVADARALLIRTRNERTNWSGPKDKGGGDGGGPSLGTLRQFSLADVAIDYRDALQNRRFKVRLSGSAQQGLRINGTGEVRGSPVRINASGAPFDRLTNKGRWPFALHIEGKTVSFDMTGTMARPLDGDDLEAEVKARGAGLGDVDALIEAGLPDTQPVRMAATLQRRGSTWRIEGLAGTVGRSDFSGEAVIEKQNGHTHIDGRLSAKRFDFADLASDAGKAKADAKTARIGEHVVPDTAIDLSNLGDTDGVLRLHADRLLWPGSEPFRGLDGTLTLKDKTLSVDPLRFAMPHGTLSGQAKIVQQDAGPRLHLRLELQGGRLSDLFPGAGIDAPTRGRLDLTGTGKTLRAAIGTADGRLTLVALDGTLPDKTALLLGQDVGGGLFAGKKKQAQLRCLIAPFTFTDGTAKTGDVRIDTSRAVTRARGTIRFPSEQLNLALYGVAKQDSTLRLDGAVPVKGTIKSPDISVPESGDSVGDILGQIGKKLFGKREEKAGDLNCGGEIAKAMDF
ncbi:AsmA family protein [Stakelama pacifica]|uniref:AsmA domain-containing protein n=1 Tax=Stakelama pacifica TaxID=517720 RepID=A0A4R6FFI6_9SPHN|nr:AsmA-like C-terminal region-containing protein [Stakelama pacifica]TDN79907.1 hypothetical protein EV664_11164 [Stakelama pacifica]GGO98176.1 hypothetical protein GCM10011329_28720 [Stakelama pacifica]